MAVSASCQKMKLQEQNHKNKVIITHCFHESSGPHVDIVVVIVVVVVVIVIVVVVIVQVIVVSHSYHCHKDGRQECKQAEMFLS